MSTMTCSRDEAVELAVRRAVAQLAGRKDRYAVSVEEYVAFRRDGFLIVPGLVSPPEIAELRQHTDDLMQGRLPVQTRVMEFDGTEGGPVKKGTQIQELETAPPAHLSPEEKANYWLRLHMLHRKLELHERYMLHPRVLDVLEAIIGPDILAMQTMLFLKGPGKPGQGYHQDSYYIPTYPDSLCGAWIAIDDVDEENGCMYFTPGSQHEPIYPPEEGYGYGDRGLKGITQIRGVSDTDDSKNTLARIAAERYGGVKGEVAARMKAGDVAFFGGHVFHRSHTNTSKNRFRRSFVSHYCNARAFTPWGADAALGVDPVTGSSSASHILARGDTHLPFARPKFGTPCAALIPAEKRLQTARIGGAVMGMGGMGGKMGMGSMGMK